MSIQTLHLDCSFQKMQGCCRLKKVFVYNTMAEITPSYLVCPPSASHFTQNYDFSFSFSKQCKCCQQGQAQLRLLLSYICIWNLLVGFLCFGHGAQCPWGPDHADGCILTIKEHHDISKVNIRYLKNFKLWKLSDDAWRPLVPFPQTQWQNNKRILFSLAPSMQIFEHVSHHTCF